MADELVKDWGKLRLTAEEDKVYGGDCEEPDDVTSKSRIDLSLRLNDNVAIRMIETNLFIIQFFEESDKRRVLEGRPWDFDNQIFLLQELNGDDQPFEVSFQFSPFWVRALDVPFSRHNPRFAKEIVDSFGGLVEFDDTDPLGWEKYMCVNVMIDVEKPLRRENEEDSRLVFQYGPFLAASPVQRSRINVADREKERQWVDNLSRGKIARKLLYNDLQAIHLGPPSAARKLLFNSPNKMNIESPKAREASLMIVTDPNSKKSVLRPVQLQQPSSSQGVGGDDIDGSSSMTLPVRVENAKVPCTMSYAETQGGGSWK
uniref:DUF4283 domain-containing protein n=1 Tax=Chenopodium quinoa TaxID=63459 RepID=A0A803MZD8_CHEQI